MKNMCKQVSKLGQNTEASDTLSWGQKAHGRIFLPRKGKNYRETKQTKEMGRILYHFEQALSVPPLPPHLLKEGMRVSTHSLLLILSMRGVGKEGGVCVTRSWSILIYKNYNNVIMKLVFEWKDDGDGDNCIRIMVSIFAGWKRRTRASQ